MGVGAMLLKGYLVQEALATSGMGTAQLGTLALVCSSVL